MAFERALNRSIIKRNQNKRPEHTLLCLLSLVKVGCCAKGSFGNYVTFPVNLRFGFPFNSSKFEKNILVKRNLWTPPFHSVTVSLCIYWLDLITGTGMPPESSESVWQRKIMGLHLHTWWLESVTGHVLHVLTFSLLLIMVPVVGQIGNITLCLVDCAILKDAH